MIMNPNSHDYNSPQITFHSLRRARRLKGQGLRLRVDCPYSDTGYTIKQNPHDPRRPLLQRQRGTIRKCHACEGQIDNPFFTVGCEYCNEWYHLRCVAISKDPAVVSQEWQCSTCEKFITVIRSFTRQSDLDSFMERKEGKTSPSESGKCTSNLSGKCTMNLNCYPPGSK